MAPHRKPRHILFMTLFLMIASALTLLVGCPSPVEPDPWQTGEPPPVYVPPPTDGELLYIEYCAFCHGDEGEGYVSDNANALANTQFLEVATDDFLKDSIRYGRPGTPMAAWGVDYGGPLVDKHIEEILNHMHTFNSVVPKDVHDSKSLGMLRLGLNSTPQAVLAAMPPMVLAIRR